MQCSLLVKRVGSDPASRILEPDSSALLSFRAGAATQEGCEVIQPLGACRQPHITWALSEGRAAGGGRGDRRGSGATGEPGLRSGINTEGAWLDASHLWGKNLGCRSSSRAQKWGCQPSWPARAGGHLHPNPTLLSQMLSQHTPAPGDVGGADFPAPLSPGCCMAPELLDLNLCSSSFSYCSF